MSLVPEHDRAPDDPRGPLLAALAGRTVAIVGYGNQGSAHALNLRDAGVTVIVGARRGSASSARAQRDGFDCFEGGEAARRADLVVLGVPDTVAPALCRDELMPAMRPGAVLGFMHGFALRFGGLRPRADLGVVLVAPKGPGTALRERFREGLGIPCLFAVAQPGSPGDAEAIGLGWAAGLGCARAGIIRTTVAHETETDLFGEQAILCGGVVALARAGYELLVRAGYPPELAYVECIHELKQVVDLVFERGIEGMYRAVSDTAEFGGRMAAKALDGPHLRARLESMLEQIRSGAFAERIMEDQARSWPWLEGARAEGRADPIEVAGEAVRGWMPWMAMDSGAPAPPRCAEVDLGAASSGSGP